MPYIPGLRHRGGYAVITPMADGVVQEEYDTFQCGHCNSHFRLAKKGPKEIALCVLCHEPRCRREACQVCIPFEARLEAMEGRRRFWKQLEIV